MKFVLGKKSGMTTIYNDDGAQNVTLITVEPNTVDLIRDEEKDGYRAVRLSMQKTAQKTYTREFRVDEDVTLKKGDTVDASIFAVGDTVNVAACSKAKGFQGVVKRHGFKGGPASHGHRHVLRTPGSIGSAYPQHVLKGRKMAGRMGGTRVTARGLKVVDVDVENNMIAVKGAVPGVAGRPVEIINVS
ncbi:MAG: 50S ribosomal protein L3 [Candidatus Moraniibacteriota bacterium]|nr:MAG: 50S ribosomal protein L3 [Candidatus Moranbacteria bacterium]